MKFGIGLYKMLSLFLMIILGFAACGPSSNHAEEKLVQNEGSSLEKKLTTNSVEGDISFLDGEGKTVSLNDMKGKVVFINFWAIWCQPCIQEMPTINKLKETFKGNDNIVFLMVDVEGHYESSQAFMDKHNYDLPVMIPNSKIPPEFLEKVLPTTIILGKHGDIVAKIEGGRDYSSPEVVSMLKEIIAI